MIAIEPQQPKRFDVKSYPAPTYRVGDATFINPNQHKPVFIMHCCNDQGGWGRGFVTTLSKKWPQPERAYRRNRPQLGSYQMVQVEPKAFVVNIVGQRGYGADGRRYVDYGALEDAFKAFAEEFYAARTSMHIQMPRLGAGLAGGDWEHIEWLIAKHLVYQGFNVTVYDLP